jgi:beta-phosphoglucomutase
MKSEPIAVIWDVDGTLVDTAELHFQAWERMSGEMGRPFSRDDFAATFGRRNPEIIRFLFRQEFTDQEVGDIGERKEGYYRTEAEKSVALLPGVRDLLEGFRAAGVRQAIGSSAPRQNVEMIMRLTKTSEFFEALVGMEDTQRGKPDPQVFLTAAEKLGVPPSRCLVLEDAIAGVQAAKGGGMKCVAVTFAGHHPAEKLKEAGADLVVGCFTEVRAADLLGLIR